MSDRSAEERAPLSLDSLLPPEMALKAEASGVAKAALPGVKTFVLACLAGAFIALGAVFSTTATAGGGAVLPYGLVKCIGGLTFSLGLILVIVAGAELFTGNNLIVMAWAGRKISTKSLLRNWGIVYAGNMVGSVATAGLVFFSGHHMHGAGAVGENALAIANAKCSLGFASAVALGALCNVLVCLAVWLCMSARTTTDKILAVLFPITAFVAAGFEHSVANMYFVPSGLLIKSGAADAFWTSTGASPEQFSALGLSSFLRDNLVPVTIGNIIGGALLVGLVYWFVYLRGRR